LSLAEEEHIVEREHDRTSGEMNVITRLVSGIAAGLLSTLTLADPINSNVDLIKLLQARLGDPTILQAIDSSPNAKFDTSANALILLKKNGASDAVIQRVLTKSTPQSSPAAAPGTTGQPVLPAQAAAGNACGRRGADGRMPVGDEGNQIDIARAKSNVELDGVGRTIGTGIASLFTFGLVRTQGKGVVVVEGKAAPTRLSGNEPELLHIGLRTEVTPEDGFALVRLAVAENSRSIHVGEVSSGIRGTRTKIEFPADALIPLEITRIQESCTYIAQGGGRYTLHIYSAKPKAPLAAGEYGVVFPGPGWVFDFGVDKQ
jgi:hypothetical protein